MTTLLKSLTIAAITIAPMSAHAGGLAPAVEETAPIVIVDEPAAAPSSLPSYVVPLLLLGALVGLAAASGSEGGSDGGAKGLITQ